MIYIYVAIFFLWTAITLYLLLGGADFGAGVLEFFTGKKEKARAKRVMYVNMGPVWEANHMWLIIYIVVLFVAFPTIYSIMSTYLYIPILAMLLGIIARGTAFSFYHYDAIKDNWQKLYDKVFIASSLWTPFFLGIIAASTISGTINIHTTDFLEGYIYSWLTSFSISVGVFVVMVCGYLASSYTLAQAHQGDDILFLKRKVSLFLVLTLITGFFVFIAAYASHIPLFEWIFGNWVGLFCVLIATLALIAVIFCLNKQKNKWVRVFVAIQILTILFSVAYQHFPNLLILTDGKVSLLNAGSAIGTLKMLTWALVLGCIFILPGVFHLIYSFQKRLGEKVNNKSLY